MDLGPSNSYFCWLRARAFFWILNSWKILRKKYQKSVFFPKNLLMCLYYYYVMNFWYYNFNFESFSFWFIYVQKGVFTRIHSHSTFHRMNHASDLWPALTDWKPHLSLALSNGNTLTQMHFFQTFTVIQGTFSIFIISDVRLSKFSFFSEFSFKVFLRILIFVFSFSVFSPSLFLMVPKSDLAGSFESVEICISFYYNIHHVYMERKSRVLQELITIWLVESGYSSNHSNINKNYAIYHN